MYLTGASSIREASVLITLSENAARPPHEDDITTTLFLPPVDPLEVMWSGLPATPEQVQSDLSALSSVVFRDDSTVASLLKSAGVSSSPDGAPLLTLPLTPSPHGLPSGYKASPSKALLSALHEARTVKTKEEIEIMRNANAISSRAHDAVMKGMAVKACKSEAEAEAVWTASIKMEGAKQIAYESIFGTFLSARRPSRTS